MNPTKKASQYVVRFDDICPTMNWSIWAEVESVIREACIRPLLAVVPNNQDAELHVDAPSPDFWERVRKWQAQGWTIGLHGYEHKYVTKESGIMGLNRYSEFAGLPQNLQAEKLRLATAIFEREGVIPEAWIAPAHSFDRITVRLLAEYGLRVISDGFSRWPYRDGLGLVWVPQQLWGFRPWPNGIWTVCCHCNKWTSEDMSKFRVAIREFGSQITSIPDVLVEFGGRQQTLMDSLHSLAFRYGHRSRWRLARGIARVLMS